MPFSLFFTQGSGTSVSGKMWGGLWPCLPSQGTGQWLSAPAQGPVPRLFLGSKEAELALFQLPCFTHFHVVFPLQIFLKKKLASVKHGNHSSSSAPLGT